MRFCESEHYEVCVGSMVAGWGVVSGRAIASPLSFFAFLRVVIWGGLCNSWLNSNLFVLFVGVGVGVVFVGS